MPLLLAPLPSSLPVQARGLQGFTQEDAGAAPCPYLLLPAGPGQDWAWQAPGGGPRGTSPHPGVQHLGWSSCLGSFPIKHQAAAVSQAGRAQPPAPVLSPAREQSEGNNDGLGLQAWAGGVYVIVSDL